MEIDAEIGKHREPPIAPASRDLISLCLLICADFLKSATNIAKKSAITQSIRLQFHEIRICAISVLIMTTGQKKAQIVMINLGEWSETGSGALPLDWDILRRVVPAIVSGHSSGRLLEQRARVDARLVVRTRKQLRVRGFPITSETRSRFSLRYPTLNQSQARS